MNDEWQSFLDKHPESNFLQSHFWAETNRLIGHKVIVELIADKIWCLMVIKNAKRGRYLEIPGGPLLDWQDTALVKKVFAEVKQIARDNHCVFIRFRPQLLDTEQNRTTITHLGAKLSPMHLHAQNTVILDLTKSEDDLLAGMRRQTRYEVRRAAKLGITVEKSHSAEALEEFHSAQSTTAERQHFIPPTKEALIAELAAFGNNATFYTAKDSDNHPIAYGFILRDNHEAAYFEAASTELNHKLPGAYALLWEVIKDAKSAGCSRLNLWGIAPSGAANHRYAGVTTFKTGFGGEVTDYIPAHDIVINPLKYSLTHAIEIIRKKRRHL